jgi:transposase
MSNAAAVRTRRPWSREFTPQQDFPRLGEPDAMASASGTAKSIESRKRKADAGERGPSVFFDPDYSNDEVELFRAILEWRGRTHRSHPTNSEMLGLIRGLGYQKVPHGYKLVPIGELVGVVEEGQPDGDDRPILKIHKGDPC